MGNSLTWTELCSTFQIYLNLNLRAKLREWKFKCQKNSVNPKGTQIARYSTALKEFQAPLCGLYGLHLSIARWIQDSLSTLWTLWEWGEYMREWTNTSQIWEGLVLKFCIWMLKDLGKSGHKKTGVGTSLCQIETFSHKRRSALWIMPITILRHFLFPHADLLQLNHRIESI